MQTLKLAVNQVDPLPFSLCLLFPWTAFCSDHLASLYGYLNAFPKQRLGLAGPLTQQAQQIHTAVCRQCH